MSSLQDAVDRMIDETAELVEKAYKLRKAVTSGRFPEFQVLMERQLELRINNIHRLG